MGASAPTELRVAIGIEETRFGREQGSPSVHVDRAALENDAGLEQRQAQLGRNATRHDVIQIVGRILPTPGVVSPVENRRLASPAGVTLDEDRAMIAAPRVIRRIVMEENATPSAPSVSSARAASDRRAGPDTLMWTSS